MVSIILDTPSWGVRLCAVNQLASSRRFFFGFWFIFCFVFFFFCPSMSPTGACIRGGEMQLYCLRAAVINYFLPDKIFSITWDIFMRSLSYIWVVLFIGTLLNFHSIVENLSERTELWLKFFSLIAMLLLCFLKFTSQIPYAFNKRFNDSKKSYCTSVFLVTFAPALLMLASICIA